MFHGKISSFLLKITALLILVFFTAILSAQTSYDDAPLSKKQLKRRHRYWLPCDLIFGKDTTHVKIKYKNNYSDISGFNVRRIIISDSNEEEQVLKPKEFSEIIVHIDSISDKYISLYNDNIIKLTNQKDLYFVVVDGECQLLSSVNDGADAGHLPINGSVSIYYL
jgi:hypothetical protein